MDLIQPTNKEREQPTMNITKTKHEHFLYDHSEVQFATDGDGFWPLTDCCGATGKGSECESGVVCRNCYEEVPSEWGAYFSNDEFWQMQNENGISK
jgi:hypothetical protein